MYVVCDPLPPGTHLHTWKTLSNLLNGERLALDWRDRVSVAV